ncbi:MAG: hypothetical protein Q8Q23_01205 [bacterium]|nr:hypothetical protein [bacterium]
MKASRRKPIKDKELLELVEWLESNGSLPIVTAVCQSHQKFTMKKFMHQIKQAVSQNEQAFKSWQSHWPINQIWQAREELSKWHY